MPVSIKKDLKDEKQQHPYDLIFYYSYLYKVIRHGENPIDGGAIRSLLVSILNILLRIKNNINDSLKNLGVLPDDGQKWVKDISDEFYLDQKNPRIEVVIKEIDR